MEVTKKEKEKERSPEAPGDRATEGEKVFNFLGCRHCYGSALGAPPVPQGPAL